MPGKKIKSASKPAPESAPKSATKPASKPIKAWSLYPSHHDAVANLLEEANLFFDFHPVDDSECEDEYDTKIMGRFICRNPACPSHGWSSKVIPITIRKYRGARYNARVYHQHCKACNQLSKPKLDDSYADRVAYRIKKWSGVPVEKPHYEEKKTPPHRSDLCEGCKHGHCKAGTTSGLRAWKNAF